MNLSEKLHQLRALEGQLRGYGRALSKSEVVRLMHVEVGQTISHAYLCQLESGARDHMSPSTRSLLAGFFKVHPGYLVSDPADFQTGIVSDVAPSTGDLRAWLSAQAEAMRDDPDVYHVLLRLARENDPRRYFLLLNRLLDMPAESFERFCRDVTDDGTPDDLLGRTG